MTPGERTSRAGGAVSPELLEAAARAAAPRLTSAALDARFGPRSSWVPVPGQLWRAAHGDVTALVVLVAVYSDTVTAAPVTTEPIAVSADVVALDAEATALGVPATVWPGLARELPVSVLDRPVDDLGGVLADRLRDRVGASHPGSGPDHPLAVDAVTAAVAADLDDDLGSLADVAAAEAVPVPPPAPEPAAGIDLDDVEPEDLDVVADRLGIGLPVVFDLIDGKRPATPEQAQVLREVLGAVPTVEPPPPGLVLELRQPRWRGLVRHRGRRDQLPEEAARAALTQDVFALAARQTGEKEAFWPDRIRRWADAHGLDPDADA